MPATCLLLEGSCACGGALLTARGGAQVAGAKLREGKGCSRITFKLGSFRPNELALHVAGQSAPSVSRGRRKGCRAEAEKKKAENSAPEKTPEPTNGDATRQNGLLDTSAVPPLAATERLFSTSELMLPPDSLSFEGGVLKGTPQGGGPGGGNQRAGLFRTPISGGVHSATSSHGLPSPAVAVRNLIEQARYAHLCTIMSRMHHRRRGYPFGSLVDFAPDDSGHLIFSLSPLAIHTRNILADPRCTLVVQMPGWSGLANARVTIFGDVLPLPRDQQEWAQQLYQHKHFHGASQQWGNFYFYRMEHISDIYFVGGFGTVAWVDVKEYAAASPDAIAANYAEDTLQELNGRFSKELRRMLARVSQQKGGPAVDDAALISIDSKGVDIRVREGAQFNVQRMSFERGHPVETLEQANDALRQILDRASSNISS